MAHKLCPMIYRWDVHMECPEKMSARDDIYVQYVLYLLRNVIYTTSGTFDL